jgi:UDP-glucose 4-epimerase
MTSTTLLLTGANGFIGAAIARAWRKAGGRVVGLLRSPAGRECAHLDLAAQLPTLTAEGIEGAVTRFAPDVLLHAAGSASVGASLRDPAADFAASVVTLQAVLEGMRRSRHRPRLLFPSSAAVYGEPDTLPIPETAPYRPLSPYGYHKAIAELLAGEYARCFEIPVLVFRLFSVFGPHQRRLLVRELFEQFGRGQVVNVQGSGNETRDLLHEDDLGEALLAMLPRLTDTHTVVNLATGRGTRVRDLAQMIQRILGSKHEVCYANRERRGDPLNWAADTRRLQGLAPGFSFGAAYDLEGRLRTTLAAWQKTESL